MQWHLLSLGMGPGTRPFSLRAGLGQSEGEPGDLQHLEHLGLAGRRGLAVLGQWPCSGCWRLCVCDE